MMAMSSGLASTSSAPHRRKIVPYAMVSIVAVVIAATSWVLTFRSQPASHPVSCSPLIAGTSVSSTMLIGEHVVPLSDVHVRVYSANGKVGQATTVAEQLRQLDLVLDEQVPYGNDPIVENQDLGCFGQLRYDEQFNGHAAVLHVLFPCFELIHDGRPDAAVDTPLGKGFRDLEVASQVEETLSTSNCGEQADLEGLNSLGSSTCS